MKKTLFYLITLLFLIKNIKSQTFQKTFGGIGDDYATDVIQTSDKGCAIMGVLGFGNVYLLKTDSLGNKQWSKTLALQTPASGELRTFAQTADGGYIFSGVINYSNTNYSYVVKMDAVGNITWSKMHVALSMIMSIKQTIEGDYIAVGKRFTDSKSTIVRFTSTGDIMWSRTLQMSSSALDVIQLASDSSFITCYYSSSFTFSRFSKNANLMWSKTVTGSIYAPGSGYGHLHENGNNVQVTFNGSSCPGLLVINKNGSNAKFSGLACPYTNYFLSDAFPAANKGSFLVGQFNIGSGYGTRDIFLALVDSLGSLTWAKQIGGVNDELPTAIKRTKDKGAIIAGSTKSFSSGKNDIYLIKTDSLGQSGCHTSVLTTFTTTTLTAGLTNYTGIVDSLYGNVTSLQNVTLSNPSEVMYNACVCTSPVASFTPDIMGNMQDNSTWADKWYWSCTCTAGIDSTTINKSYYNPMIPNGTYTVCLKVKNSCGVDSTCHPFNYVFFPVSVREIEESIVYNFYPNPFHNKLIVSRKDDRVSLNLVQVRIINSFGALVYSDSMDGSKKELLLDLLAPGLYFIQLLSDDKVATRKLIKE